MTSTRSTGTVTKPATGNTLPARFESVATRWPNRIAVSAQDECLTYAELDRAANRLAHLLQELGAGPGVLVALCLDRTADLIVGMLGILKSGAGYLPLDPRYPVERLDLMLADAGCELVVGRLPAGGTTAARAVATEDPRLAHQPSAAPLRKAASSDTAYVIFTSGSTGRPKGVVVSHANVTRLFDVTETEFRPSEADVWSMFHSVAFDFSVWEIWGALLYGGQLSVVP